jgi:hypothetical protein
VPNTITNAYKRPGHNQRANTSEGGHTNDESARTSEGANALTKSLSVELVPIQLLRHGNFQHGHRPGKSPLVPATPRQCGHSPCHWKRNGIHGPYERP